MEETEVGKQGFIAYEYKEMTVDSNRASFMIDCYENFGWELDERMAEHEKRSNVSKKIILRMKRNRKIVNKVELTRLQRHFEACVEEMKTLEKNKTSMASIYGFVIGIIGTVFMTFSTFAVTGNPQHILLSIIFAIPGFVGWITPYFIYRKVVRKQIEKVTPLIEAKYDEIYKLCEKGNKLLYCWRRE